jgi:hypothetical protein
MVSIGDMPCQSLVKQSGTLKVSHRLRRRKPTCAKGALKTHGANKLMQKPAQANRFRKDGTRIELLAGAAAGPDQW